MVEDEEVNFDTLHSYLLDKDLGNWDNVYDEDIIKQYVNDMMLKGIHVSHILEALESHPSSEGLYSIWLGNSMETPTPINNKLELVEALGLE